MRKFLLDKKAVTAIEYALIASLIAVVVITGIRLVGSGVTDQYSYIGSAVDNAM